MLRLFVIHTHCLRANLDELEHMPFLLFISLFVCLLLVLLACMHQYAEFFAKCIISNIIFIRVAIQAFFIAWQMMWYGFNLMINQFNRSTLINNFYICSIHKFRYVAAATAVAVAAAAIFPMLRSLIVNVRSMHPLWLVVQRFSLCDCLSRWHSNSISILFELFFPSLFILFIHASILRCLPHSHLLSYLQMHRSSFGARSIARAVLVLLKLLNLFISSFLFSLLRLFLHRFFLLCLSRITRSAIPTSFSPHFMSAFILFCSE